MPRSLERIIIWLCFAVGGGFAAIATAVPVLAVAQGEVARFSRYINAKHLLAQEPLAFWVAVLLHSFAAALCWLVLVIGWRLTKGLR
jgi:hypothetical protein